MVFFSCARAQGVTEVVATETVPDLLPFHGAPDINADADVTTDCGEQDTSEPVPVISGVTEEVKAVVTAAERVEEGTQGAGSLMN